LRDIATALDEYKNNRVDEIVNNISMFAKYKEIVRNIKTVYENILSNIDDSCRNLVEEYDEMILEKEDFIFQNLYQQAFLDGLQVGLLLNNTIFREQKQNEKRD